MNEGKEAFCIFKTIWYNKATSILGRGIQSAGENRNVLMTCPVQNHALVCMGDKSNCCPCIADCGLYGAWSEARLKQYLLVFKKLKAENFSRSAFGFCAVVL